MTTPAAEAAIQSGVERGRLFYGSLQKEEEELRKKQKLNVTPLPRPFLLKRLLNSVSLQDGKAKFDPAVQAGIAAGHINIGGGSGSIAFPLAPPLCCWLTFGFVRMHACSDRDVRAV
jgi:hypothetical protein